MASNKVIRAVGHIGSALDLFTQQKPEWGVSEASVELGLAKSSTHELFVSLSQIGLLEQLPTRRYCLGWRLLSLSRTLVTSNQERERIVQALQRLVLRLGVTANLAVLDRGRAVYLHRAIGNKGIRTPTTLGRRTHAHISGVGKILLAALPGDELRRVVDVEGLPEYTPSTITAVTAFHRELDRVREQGWAEDQEEAVKGVCCIAAPIRLHGEVHAAISVVQDAETFQRNRDRHRAEIVAVARGLSR